MKIAKYSFQILGLLAACNLCWSTISLATMTLKTERSVQVANLNDAEIWYTKKLGFISVKPEKGWPEPGGKTSLRMALSGKPGPMLTLEKGKSTSKNPVILLSDNIDADYKQLVERGIAFSGAQAGTPKFFQAKNNKYVLFSDPFGNMFMLFGADSASVKTAAPEGSTAK